MKVPEAHHGRHANGLRLSPGTQAETSRLGRHSIQYSNTSRSSTSKKRRNAKSYQNDNMNEDLSGGEGGTLQNRYSTLSYWGLVKNKGLHCIEIV